MHVRTACRLSLIAVLGLSPIAAAQDATPKVSTPQTDPSNPQLWNTEAMMDTAVQQLTRRYNLSPEQEAYTNALLKRRVREFLREHEAELRSLLGEAIELQMNPTKVDSNRMQAWSTRALPIFEGARKAILDGNDEWRNQLTDVQKQIHDRDLAQMKTNFTDMDGKFNRWSQGGFKPEDLYPAAPGQPNALTGGMGSPGSSRGQITRGPNVSKPEDFWEVHVNRLINKYKFTKEQSEQARAVLAGCRKQAADYRQTKKEQFVSIQKQLDAVDPRTDPKRYNELQKQNLDLNKYIRVDLLSELTKRVEGLATAEQRSVVDAEQAARKARTLDDRKTRSDGVGEKAGEPAASDASTTTMPKPAGEAAAEPASAGADKPAADASSSSTADAPKPAAGGN